MGLDINKDNTLKRFNNKRRKENERVNEKSRESVCSSHVCRGWRVRNSEGHPERKQEITAGRKTEQIRQRPPGPWGKKVRGERMHLFIDRGLMR